MFLSKDSLLSNVVCGFFCAAVLVRRAGCYTFLIFRTVGTFSITTTAGGSEEKKVCKCCGYSYAEADGRQHGKFFLCSQRKNIEQLVRRNLGTTTGMSEWSQAETLDFFSYCPEQTARQSPQVVNDPCVLDQEKHRGNYPQVFVHGREATAAQVRLAAAWISGGGG